jgi:hypothetical protein
METGEEPCPWDGALEEEGGQGLRSGNLIYPNQRKYFYSKEPQF